MKSWLLALSAVGIFVIACGHDDDDDHSHSPTGEHTSPFASCQAILDACHSKDVGEGPSHDCHEVAHDTGANEAGCAAKKTECVATCNASDGGTAASGHTSPFASCQAIIDACHTKDVGEGPIHDCHDVASDPAASEASCSAKKAECSTTCAGDGGAT